jgi:hypothetical protein
MLLRVLALNGKAVGTVFFSIDNKAERAREERRAFILFLSFFTQIMINIDAMSRDF